MENLKKQAELSQEAIEADVMDAYFPSEDLTDTDYHPEFDEKTLNEQSLAFKKIREKRLTA